MASFKDIKGKEWDLRLTHGLVLQLKAATGVDLYKALDNRLAGLNELTNDPEKFVGFIYALVEKQAVADQVQPEDFAMLLDGDTLEAMGTAFMEALASFFPRQRAALLEVAKRSRDVMDELQRRALKALEDLPVDKVTDQMIRDRASSALSTSSPARSA